MIQISKDVKAKLDRMAAINLAERTTNKETMEWNELLPEMAVEFLDLFKLLCDAGVLMAEYDDVRVGVNSVFRGSHKGCIILSNNHK